MTCNKLPPNENQKEHIKKKSKPFSEKVDRSQCVEESDSDNEIVSVYPKQFTVKKYNIEKNQIFSILIERRREVIAVTIYQKP